MRIKNRKLTATLYTYVQPVNARRAKAKGKDWGSFSNYVNHLIAKDHGDKASMKESEAMKEIFLTPSPARTTAKKKPAKKATKRKAAGKKSKRVSARRPSKKTARTPAKSSRKVAFKSRQQKVASRLASVSRASTPPKKATKTTSKSLVKTFKKNRAPQANHVAA